MNNIIVIFVSGLVGLFFWSGGYFVKEHTRELILPNWVKFLYGKPNKPIYGNGALLQTIGYIQALYTIQLVMYLLGHDFILPPKFLLLLFTLIAGIPLTIDSVIQDLFNKK
jgi:hypothetical protein